MKTRKTLLLTGATDGIGLETARRLTGMGHRVLLHGRNASRLDEVRRSLSEQGEVEVFMADLSRLSDVDALADAVLEREPSLDVLINNAGVFRVPDPVTSDGLDVRFMVNTIAPYHLTRRLWKRLGVDGRVVNLSSAAQAPVDVNALKGGAGLEAMSAYAQSKLAITQWTLAMARQADAPVMLAVNPGSLLASKMVKQGFGVEGKSLAIGAEVLCRAALDEAFAERSGQYFDNDVGDFAAPHPDALKAARRDAVVEAIESVIQSSSL